MLERGRTGIPGRCTTSLRSALPDAAGFWGEDRPGQRKSLSPQSPGFE